MTRFGADGSLDALDDRAEFDLPARVDEVSPVRRSVAGFLAERGVPSVLVEDMELVTSELVTNAIVHPDGGPSAEVHVTVVVSDTVVISVANDGSAAAIPPVDRWRPAPPHALSGRGLGIVRRLCDTVSVVQVGARTVVTGRRRLPDRLPST